ncbi:alpha/beta hydrolase [Prochlorococcus sp. MIT 1223]|uniref:alpha/beta hydrolase n=1 Tax=Prochlorococcus sp. MIT 1223 TaxID=3096217 RepID=UPI002A752020|nr:alpha/beta hydrolase [Prochlorococcus sp. MIT 1223]
MKEIIAMHGWGGDCRTWDTWRKSFMENQWLWTSLNRGYGDIQAQTSNWHNSKINETTTKRVLICHSLGLHLINRSVLEDATHIVLISSFGRFLPEGNESRSIKIALKGMQQALGSSSEKEMLINFLKKACNLSQVNILPEGPIKDGLSNNGRKQLQDDLNLLIKTSGLPENFPIHARVLTVYGDEDQIVHPQSKTSLRIELNKKLLNPPSHWDLSSQGHSIVMPELIQRTQTWLEATK